MEIYRDDIEALKHDEEVKQAYDIMLALCREYSVEIMQQPETQNEYRQKIKQIKNDIKQLDRVELIRKVNSLYLPLLKKMEQKHYPSEK
ncbi:MAG: hypothetical protein IKS23_03165 [Alphaproteobacteria bacterium]|nr:hypothetical protein [Alphaproteobacteria bacterium]